MKNFVYHNPTKIIFGQQTIPAIGAETRLHGKRVLLVYGQGSIKRQNIYQTVVESMQAAGLDIIEYSGVQPNPLLSHTRTGIELAKKEKCDVICGVGGGSVLDEAKAISAGATVNHDVWKFFTGKKSITTPLPLTCVSTFAASGSDMNPAMVLTNDDTQQKFGFANRKLHPKTSILDPETLYSVPALQTAYGAVDIISHALEFYFTTEEKSVPVQDRFMEGLVINAIESCDQIVEDPRCYDARAALMWSASLALCGLSASGLGKVAFPMHLIEHSLSALYNVAHGAGLSVIILGWMKSHCGQLPARFAQFGRRVYNIHGKNDVQTGQEAIDRFEQWLLAIGCPTRLGDLQPTGIDIDGVAENTQSLARVWRIKNYDPVTVKSLLKRCL